MEVRRLLRETPPGDGRAACEAVARWLGGRPGSLTVASYAAMADEVDLLPLLEWLPEHRWVLPRVVGDELVFHEVRDAVRDLVVGAFGIREPTVGLAVVAIPEVDVFLCPGLAFDRTGGRLGRGRGFYDRILAAARPGAIRVGVCHPLQRVADVHPETHDVPMDWLIDGTKRPNILAGECDCLIATGGGPRMGTHPIEKSDEN